MLNALIISFTAVALLLCLLLLRQVRAVSRVGRLKAHRSGAPGVADLLNYACVVEDGVIVCKDGSLLAAWEYAGEDNAGATAARREEVSFRINQALHRLGNGWCCHLDAVRKAVPAYSPREASHFPDPVTAAIDEERRRFFESQGTLYETRFIMTVSYKLPPTAVRRFSDLMFDDDLPRPDGAKVARNALEQFKRDVGALENRLSSVFKLRRLRARAEADEYGEAVYDDLLSHLQRCVTGIDQPVRRPRNPALLDAVLGAQELWGGTRPRIGRKFIQCVSIEHFPTESFPGMLTALGELPCEARWSTRFIFMDRWEAISRLEGFRRKWAQQIKPFICQVLNLPSSNVNEDALSMAEDAGAAKMEVNSGEVSAGHYTAVVVLMDEDPEALEAVARTVEKAINHLGFTARVETVNALEAFLGSLPGHTAPNLRRPLINTLNLADLLPVSSIWSGEETCPCPLYPAGSPPLCHALTTGNAPFRINLHVRDVGNTFITGPIGAGKSVLLNVVEASLLRYPRMTLFVFDVGMSGYALCKAAGGRHYRVAADNDQLAFCPLQHLQGRSDRAWATDWLEQVLRLSELPVPPERHNKIARSIDVMHQRGFRTMTDFVKTVQDLKVREAFKAYTAAGSFGHVFDAQEDGLEGLGSFVCFEVEELMGLDPKYCLPTLWYLFRRIERLLQGQPAAIILDEAWKPFGHPLFREKIREWLKTKRKANCAVVMATQSVMDAQDSGLLSVLHESCATKIFLPNLAAREEGQRAIYRRFGLNDRQVEIIARAVPKREYYLVSEKGRRLFDLCLGPLALALLGVSDKDSVAAVQRCEASHGEGWVDEWLARRGLKLSDFVSSETQAEERLVPAV
jgi:type IV secretion system protein VirB4